MKTIKQQQINRTKCPICGLPVKEIEARSNPIEYDYQDCHFKCFYSQKKEDPIDTTTSKV